MSANVMEAALPQKRPHLAQLVFVRNATTDPAAGLPVLQFSSLVAEKAPFSNFVVSKPLI